MDNQEESLVQQNDVEQQESTFGKFMKQKRLVFLVIGIVVVLLLVFFSLISSSSRKQPINNPNLVIPTKVEESGTRSSSSSTNSASATTPSLNATITTAPDTQQVVEVKTEAKPQIDQRVTSQYTMSKVKTYGSDWALLEITNSTAGPANIVLKNESGKWTVVMGPGTHFDRADLMNIGAPQNLINDANSNL